MISADIRKRLHERGVAFVASPVSGNAKVIKAGKLSAVISGPEAACKIALPLIEVFAPSGVSYVGDGELARVCKIAHNVMLGVVIENLIEITLLANKMGVPRHAFLAFMNNSVMGSMFTRYKSPALVNLDWTTTFTPELLRKDLDLGLELGREYDVPMPVTAATREVLQSHFGAATLQSNPEEYLGKDFAALMETMALASGMKLDERKQERADGTGRAEPTTSCRQSAAHVGDCRMIGPMIGAYICRRSGLVGRGAPTAANVAFIRRRGSTPDLARRFDDQFQFLRLIGLAQRIAGDRRGKAALRADRELRQIDVTRGVVDAAAQIVVTLQRRRLAADEAEHDALVLRHKPQRLEIAGARRVVFEQEMADLGFLQIEFPRRSRSRLRRDSCP